MKTTVYVELYMGDMVNGIITTLLRIFSYIHTYFNMPAFSQITKVWGK